MQAPTRDIYSVSRLNSEVRSVLEGSFPLIWVEGEISNLARPASGHMYFSLKDEQAQVRCALFRNQRLNLRFRPENGAKVLARVRISLYEGRGEYQLIVEHMEASGEGALRRAYEELKNRLDKEGLFAAETKRPLPAYPRCIGLVTSPSGAAIRDVLSVLRRRWPLARVIVYPSAVQGAEAPEQLLRALRVADRRRECDLLILTRGGGSLEDLMAFNDERLARALHALHLPVISAIGHEIDFTIADFVADRRAPTPSAAAELATPDQWAWRERLAKRKRRLVRAAQSRLMQARHAQRLLAGRLQQRHPAASLRQWMQRLDELSLRMLRGMPHLLVDKSYRMESLQARLMRHSPASRLRRQRERLGFLADRLERTIRQQLRLHRDQLAMRTHSLYTVSPLQTLQRGYAIVTSEPDGRVVTNASTLREGEHIRARMAEGGIIARIEKIL